MSTVFIVGLPKSLRRRLEAECRRNSLRCKSILADIGKEGTFVLLPVGHDGKHALHAYVDGLDNYSESCIFVLPYAPISSDLEAELEALSELGCSINYIRTAKEDWPALNYKQRPNTRFYNDVYDFVCQSLGFQKKKDRISVSGYLRKVSEECQNLIFSNYVFEECDKISDHRREFVYRAIDAFVDFLGSGSGGRIDAFFREKGLDHAQTGGITTDLRVFAAEKLVHHESSSTHLKKGDKTKPESAVRIYYQIFDYKNEKFIVVVYLGPHPDKDMGWVCYLE